ncbi:DUF1257 domain-containing protein [Blastopirellula marina]|uniref:DUF1257 domain-containing protein n=1 Tax=Blastopirellula marina TaxID=124 RepID=A0A2S8GH90_9BACT|nr:DUF1257 domain-containing protein [Blastopirellula marina]PQO43835.1 DUF1257 domain-containing protein [Blastopirellula marina]
MSHIVTIQTELRDVEAIRLAARRLLLPEPTFGAVRLFSTCATGWQIQLPQWRYPVVADINSGKLEFDNYDGRWGERRHLDRFLQGYAVEKAKLEARRRGHVVVEQPLNDGSIKLTIQLGATA